MAKFSTGLRDYINATGSVRDALADSVIQIYSGPVPASADSAITGSNILLCEVADSVTGVFNFDSVSVGGIMTKPPTSVLLGNISASGTATFYRQVLPGDANAASTVAVRIQGTIGVAGTDMEITNTTLTAGGVQRLGSHTVALLEGV